MINFTELVKIMRIPYLSISIIGLFAALTPSAFADNLYQSSFPSSVKDSNAPQVQPATQPILYVDPQSGQDTSTGSMLAPFRTITYALKNAQLGTTIQLASGKYQSSNGEVFPLIVPSGITLKGQEASKGQGVFIEGSGVYNSRTFGKQNIAILGESGAQILGVTVTNSESRGTGLWVESASPIIRSSTFTNSLREGIFVTGNSTPTIENNSFTKNSANGLSMVKNAAGTVRGNIFEQTGFGIAIGGNASPLIENNEIDQNRAGIVISDRATPTLKGNHIFNNQDNGLVVLPSATPNLAGGSNMMQSNGKYDLYASQQMINTANGNQISKPGLLIIAGDPQ